MVKKSKRKQDIKSKLLAAIAMLMVATIMMVSSTYAWFTLSTAPEVQGITTTVGANGNLEIALSPFDGDVSAITSGVGDSGKDWLLKNLTWGNLLSLQDANGQDLYGLSDITLLPSRLNFANGVVDGSPLKTPVYGADGRVQDVTGSTMYGAKDPTGAVAGFLANTGFGVRAVGTSSSQTPTQRNYYTALNNINTYRVSAQSAGKAALDQSGKALAAIAINKAANAATGYEAYKDDIANMLSLLTQADKAAEKALFNVFLALASTEAVYSQDETLYDTIKALESVSLTNAEQYIASLNAPALQAAYDAWESMHDDVTSANAAYAAIENEAAWNEAQITSVLQYLMDTTGEVKLGGFTIDEVQTQPTILLPKLGDLTLTLGEGSGLFYDLAQLAGSISSTVTIDEGTQLTYQGEPVDLGGVSITVAASEPANGALLKQLRAAVAILTPAAGNGSAVSAIDVTYGYAIDLLFRTNVANSDLKLQVAGAQRVYVDSENDATMGGGSTMTFQGVYSNLDNLVDLMDGLRVVFMSTENSNLYGIAKLVDYKVSYNNGTTDVTGLYDAATGVITGEGWAAPAEGATAVTVTAYVSLHSYEVNDAGVLVMGDEKDVNNQILCGLPQNAVQKVTALVYLDGDYVDNSDVSNSETGISMTGTMNLQFASSAVLVPMENSELRNPQNP